MFQSGGQGRPLPSASACGTSDTETPAVDPAAAAGRAVDATATADLTHPPLGDQIDNFGSPVVPPVRENEDFEPDSIDAPVLVSA